MIGTQEILLLFVLVLLLFGAKKIPELCRGLGRGLNEFRQAKREFDDEIETSTRPEAHTNG